MDNGLRYERKYYVNRGNAAILRARVAALLIPDSHSGGVYDVRNLYWDDLHNSAYTEKLGGAARRRKYRVRHYNDDLSFIRLECKQKEGSLVRKDSTKVSGEQWEALCAGRLPSFGGDSNAVWNAFGAQYAAKHLRPVLRLTYRREAFTYAPGNVRVTFDSDLRASPWNGGTDTMAFAPGESVVELKYDRFLPDVAAALFAGLSLRESAVSKYVLAREALWKVWRYDKA